MSALSETVTAKGLRPLWQNCIPWDVPEKIYDLKTNVVDDCSNRERCRVTAMRMHVGKIINLIALFLFSDVTFLITRERSTSAASLPLSLHPSQWGITKPLTTPSPFYFVSCINTTIVFWKLCPSLHIKYPEWLEQPVGKLPTFSVAVVQILDKLFINILSRSVKRWS